MHSRQHIAFTFWPDATDERARNNLRQIIHQLRQVLPDEGRHLCIEASALGWMDSPDFHLDVGLFEDAVAQATIARRNGHASDVLSALERAVGAYGGDLLPGCYDDWVLPDRERLRQSFAGVLDQLASLYESVHNLPAAITAMQRRLELDPLHEASYVALMRFHALNDDRAGALRVYHAGEAAFKSELGIEPTEVMRAAHERLKQDGVQKSTKSSAQESPPLIGRQREWEQLLTCWRDAVKGAAQFALIAGEAGIGKTRLAEELMIWAGRQGICVAHTRAYAAEGRLSFAPVVEWLRSDAMHLAWRQLDNVWLSEVGRILPEVFVEHSGLPQPPPMTDAAQRTRFFEAMARAVLAAPQPLLLVLDDVQWCDQDTLEWLRYVLRFDARASMLIVATCRSEEVDDKHPLMTLLRDLHNAGQAHEIELKRLDAAETAKLAAHIMKRGVDLGEATRLFNDTEGNPLFTVEMARAGLGNDVEVTRDATLNLPPRIHAVIASRFAKLSGPALDVMQLGATMGRAFNFDVLLKASSADEESLLGSLDELWRRRIVRAVDGERFDFTHDKLREVAYAQISPVKRRLLHRRIAQAIEAVHSTNLDPVSAQLAAHYEQAGFVQPAIEYYRRAADLMQHVFAHEEARSLINHGMALLPAVADPSQREEHEYLFLSMQSTSFGATRQYQVMDQLDVLLRAMALGQKLGKPLNPSILRILVTVNILLGNCAQSLALANQLRDLAEKVRDPILVIEGYEALGIVHFWLGNFTTAREHLEQGLKLYVPERSRDHILRFAWDSKVVCLCRLALDLCCLGYVEQAIHTQQLSIALARELDHPFSLGYSLYWNALIQHELGHVDFVRNLTEEIIKLSDAHNISWWLNQGTTLNAWSIAEQGDVEAGIKSFEHAMGEFFALGNNTFMRPFFFTLLAQLYARLGRFEHSMWLLSEAEKTVIASDERWNEAELHRTRGDVLQAMGAEAQSVEAAYQAAIRAAQSQQARLYELRASLHLARWWQSQGLFREALALLKPIFDWFTEGFDTHELKAARALIDELTIS